MSTEDTRTPEAGGGGGREEDKDDERVKSVSKRGHSCHPSFYCIFFHVANVVVSGRSAVLECAAPTRILR